MTAMETGVEKVPTYALCYLVNGDATGLTEQEVGEIDSLLREQAVELVCPPSDDEWQPYFSSCPWFGKPCEVIDCDIVYRVT